VFTWERGTPFTKRGFQAMVERAGKAAGFIQAYLGHKSIQHTVRYTELAPTRFKSLFRD
jgi:hypothetical protein